MATYVYETIPSRAGETPRRFEVVQSMKEPPLSADPVTGEPVRRIITGGFGVMTAVKSPAGGAPAAAAPAPCAPGCACHRAPRLPAF